MENAKRFWYYTWTHKPSGDTGFNRTPRELTRKQFDGWLRALNHNDPAFEYAESPATLTNTDSTVNAARSRVAALATLPMQKFFLRLLARCGRVQNERRAPMLGESARQSKNHGA